jgi:hypothetical protein
LARRVPPILSVFTATLVQCPFAAGKLNLDFDRIRADPRFVALVADAGAG